MVGISTWCGVSVYICVCGVVWCDVCNASVYLHVPALIAIRLCICTGVCGGNLLAK